MYQIHRHSGIFFVHNVCYTKVLPIRNVNQIRKKRNQHYLRLQ